MISETDFDSLIDSVEEMDQIIRGEKSPGRVTEFEDEIEEEVIVLGSAKATRAEKSARARARRHQRKLIVAKRWSNIFAKLHRMKKSLKKHR